MKQIHWTFLLLVTISAAAWDHEVSSPDQQRAEKLAHLNKNLVITEGIDIRKGDWTPAEAQNGLDSLTFAKMKQDGVPINGLCDDNSFIRRVNLLLTGRLPDPQATRDFLADTSPTKRDTYVASLMESQAFRSYWSFWFQEYFKSNSFMLRSGLPYYAQWFDEAVAANKPLDQMAVDLLTTTGLTDQVGPPNFFVRASEMARVNQDFHDNLAGFASDRFLGISVTCVSCHDGAYHLENINLYLAERKREDLWGMAAWFSGVQRREGTRDENNVLLSVNITENPSRGYNATTDRGDRPNRDAGLIQPKYMFDGSGPGSESSWLKAFANKVTSDRQFARNWSNRLWGHLFGLAMVEPMDGFDPYRIDPNRALPEGWDYQALDLNLLEYMTDQMIAFDYDLQAFLKFVIGSATFQLSSDFQPGNWKDSYASYYTRFLARRLSAESIYDSIVVATGVATPMVQVFRDGNRRQVNYAHEFWDLTQPRGQAQAEAKTFLDAFGRGNRYDQVRSETGNISQALMLMNSQVITDRLLVNQNRLVQYAQSGLSASALIDEVYLDFFCRKPSQEEKALLETELAQYNSIREQAATLQWLLINKVSFSFIW